MHPQIFCKASELSSPGQMLVIVANTTHAGYEGMLQKLDTNSWSWTFPTSSLLPPARAIGYTLALVNNTLYSYGGSSVDQYGYPITSAILNALSLMDTNSFGWSPGANGVGVTDHAMCYIKSCNCLISFGGTPTGSPNDVTQTVYVFDLGTKTWNLQVVPTSVSGAIPGARRLHTANCLDDRMIIYGGGTTQPYDSDIWTLSAAQYPKLTWERISANNITSSPNQRMGHSAVMDPKTKKVYIFGGWGARATNDSNMYVLDTQHWTWSHVPPTGYPLSIKPSSTSSPVPSSTNTHGNQSKTDTTPIIIGSVVGGVAALVIAAIIAFCCLRRRKSRASKREDIRETLSTTDRAMSKHDLWTDDHRHTEDEESRNQRDNNNGLRSFHTRSGSDLTWMSGPNSKRVSRAWTSNSRLSRPSEIGDTHKVVTGTLEEMIPPPSLMLDEYGMSSSGTRSSMGSLPTTQAPSTPLIHAIRGEGQPPNEITQQKPNEFSRPIRDFIDHCVVPPRAYPLSLSLSSTSGAPLSSSMEVLRSVKTNGSSVMHEPNRNRVRVVHAVAPSGSSAKPSDADDTSTLPDSVSVGGSISPLRYIKPGARRFSIATTATEATWNKSGKHSTTLTQPHYPSSALSSAPTAHLVTDEHYTDMDNEASPPSPSPSHPPLPSFSPGIYGSVSPLDLIANLGVDHDHERTEETSWQELIDQVAPAAPTSNSTWAHVLPQHFKLEKSIPAIEGPANTILFVRMHDKGTWKETVIKAFQRREAWERECRTLTKLKSQYVVELLQVLTISGGSAASNDSGSSSVLTRSHTVNEDDGVTYATVLERLESTLSTCLRDEPLNVRQVAREIVECLAWCHENDIAFCDLKPSNIMRDKEKRWKLIDFEACRIIGQECVGVITPRYCPPEVARATTYGREGANGVVATASVDLWALGCVIFELETKRLLFSSSIRDETILHFISHPSSSTPTLKNGLRWNSQRQLEIPNFDQMVPNFHTRQVIETLLHTEPSKRGNLTNLLKHPYFAAA
ncbi:uncharacterized protein BYT42DRAFT_560615 [Radiomyces spectabilis]|uniref:uncharacterized protein n=1 Tax=Radiomyces spectabilis TaxID=64574 RepID=UPI0022210434|nr:uncharacterized protein BYT42DRAFT_560615 [Radiomyces spectabilis]KAI8388591.1 hypothetical protein BYT42DRAFT_560615 [Radiomyces spectabilis]